MSKIISFDLAHARGGEPVDSDAVGAPTAISVVGFDDLAIARLSLPPLTTVRQDVVARGQQGARMLLRALKGESVEALLTPVTLTVRGSTGRLE